MTGSTRRRGLRPAMTAGLVGVALVLNGCGLPSKTEPKYAGPAQSAAAEQGESKVLPKPDAITPAGLVRDFLTASVGANLDTGSADPLAAPNEARDRLKQFMTEEAKAVWKPLDGLMIIRDPEPQADPLPGGVTRFTFSAHPIGTLNDQGLVENTQPQPDLPVVLEVATIRGGYRLSLPPGDTLPILITQSAFAAYYDQHPIYFYDKAAPTRLVPDLRYLPSPLSRTRQISEILGWLKSTPSGWLQQTALLQPVPTEVEFQGNPVIDGGDIRVNLGAKASTLGQEELDKLARQIRWSVPEHRRVRLSVENQASEASSEGYEANNPGVALSRASNERYCVVGGSIRPDSAGTARGLFAVSEENRNVVSGAISRDVDRPTLARAALVRQVGTANKPEFRLYATDPGTQKFVATTVFAQNGARLSRPAFLTYPGQPTRLLVADGTQLWVSTDAADGGQPRYEAVQPTAPGQSVPISAFAVAPDGHRVALVSGGKLFVAFLRFDNGKFTLGPAQTVPTTLGTVQGVGWYNEVSVVAGGKPGKAAGPSLVAVTIDGAVETVLPRNGGAPEPEVSAVVARPIGPTGTPAASVIIQAYDVAKFLYTQIQTITPEPYPDPSASASPSVAPTAVPATSCFIPD